MEKILIDDKSDLISAIEFFCKKYDSDIREIIKSYPFILIGHYCEDSEFGDMYTFTIIDIADFHKKNGVVFID